MTLSSRDDESENINEINTVKFTLANPRPDLTDTLISRRFVLEMLLHFGGEMWEIISARSLPFAGARALHKDS